MGEIRRVLERGFAEGLTAPCACMSQEEIAGVAPGITVAKFQAMIDDGTLAACPKHPGRFEAGPKAIRESIALMRADPGTRRMLG